MVNEQPLSLLRLPDVLRRTGYSRAGWYKAIAEGRAPQPLKRGAVSLWPSDVIDNYVRDEISKLAA